MKRIRPTKVRVVIGPPGTGKTTRVARAYSGELRRGTSSDRLALITFSTRARTEALRRLTEPGGEHAHPYCDVDGVRTMHSMAYQLLRGGNCGSVMERGHWERFRARTGLYTAKRERDRVLLDVLNWGRARGLTLAQTEASAPHRFDAYAFREFAAEYAAFKRSERLVDYHDTLDLVLQHQLRPAVDAILFDEAQDFSPVQALVADLWASAARRAYIVGDDDQAIFGFQGASPAWLKRQFLAHRGHVLSASHRVPRAAHELAQRIIASNRDRVRKQYAPRDAAGSIEHVNAVDDLIDSLTGGDNLVLARDSFALKPIAARLRDRGIAFVGRGDDDDDPEQQEAVDIAATAALLANGGAPAAGRVLDLLAFVDRRRRRLVPERAAVAERLAAMGETAVPAPYLEQLLAGGTLLQELRGGGVCEVLEFTDAQRRAVLAREATATTSSAHRIVLSTIHGAKGAEADVVAIVPDISRRSYEGMLADPDAERRVAYVALTRTRDRLILVQPTTRHFFHYG